jgi:3-phenylpropionate/trans-cinnamate dioxygenase ferredoxin reductase subunit
VTPRYDVIIVGSGHGGAQAAIALRQSGFEGSIAMVGEEADLPYERPALSKDYLAGAKTLDRILLRPLTFWGERNIALLPGRRVVSLDAAAHQVVTNTAETIAYGRLIWATGGYARRLSCQGHDLDGVHTIRRRTDVDRLIGELPFSRNVAIIGGGYIGLEAAAVLVGLGKKVTLFESRDRVLARVAGETLSRFYEAEHQTRGVKLELRATVDRLTGVDGRVASVRLRDGRSAAADLVIVGIGIIPAIAPLIKAGAAGEDGAEVDRSCRTSLEDVYAIGDCARRQNAFAGGAAIRLESVQNAADMALAAAKAIMGETPPHDAAPWFWSNQYDLRLQTVGLSAGFDAAVVRGSPRDRRFSIIYLKDGRVIALDCVNAAKDFVQGRALVVAGARLDPGLLADPSLPLKDIALSPTF